MTCSDLLFNALNQRRAKVRLIEVSNDDKSHRYTISHIHPHIEMFMYELFFISEKWFYRDSFGRPLKEVKGNLVDFICTEREKDEKK